MTTQPTADPGGSSPAVEPFASRAPLADVARGGSGWTLGRAVGQAAIVALLVAIIAFGLVRVAPGSEASIFSGYRADPAAQNEITRELHLNQSLFVQLGDYLSGLVHGDLGRSLLYQNRSVTSVVGQGLGVTLPIIAGAILIATLIGVPLGLAMALTSHRSLETTARLFTSTMVAIPAFLLGLILALIVGLRWHLLPVAGWPGHWPANFRYLILPSLALSAGILPLLARSVRRSAIDAMEQPWYEAALGRGLPRRVLVARHILPNSLLPCLTLIGVNVGTLIAGTIVVESVFALPGIGQILLNAINARDDPLVEGIAALAGLFVVAVNLVIDVLYRIVDPRTRRA